MEAKNPILMLISIIFVFHIVLSEDASMYCPVDAPNKPETTFVIGDTCYHLIQNSNARTTRDFARSDCQSRNGDLLTMKTKAIQDSVMAAVNERSDSHTVLLGLVKEGNHWIWVDGTIATYSNWAVTPGPQSGNCARFNAMEGGTWEIVNCGTSDWFPVYICEHNRRTKEASSNNNSNDGSAGTSFTSTHSIFTTVFSIVPSLVWLAYRR